MQKILPSPYLRIIASLFLVLMLQSCSTHSHKSKNLKYNTAITRIYLSLSSEKLKREFEIADVENILINHFNGATLQESIGFFNRKKERSLTITIVNCCRWEEPIEVFREKINNLVKQLRNDLGQESILVEVNRTTDIQVFEVLE
ncbi:MAG: hypothetical protein DHS20C13_13030 [Thermodesulfobacteriota bacterium]|nr:MAG: hypothetical protein DHS20C13_13030 [Thermodesulfobacteriota bacterium]